MAPCHTHNGTPASAPAPSEPRDPVCGMAVRPDSPFQAHHAGRHFHFCSQHCLDRFSAEPQRYAQPAAASAPAHPSSDHSGHAHHDGHAQPAAPADAAASSPAASGEYTCPMHPEVRQIGPGSCPKCGMTLEPVLPELEE
ncbi:MAG TPA: YHS domain-containing protein, partial [Pseudomonas sp.]|nr:YHS domain-containing protein [Pseudomonas sp.]